MTLHDPTMCITRHTNIRYSTHLVRQREELLLVRDSCSPANHQCHHTILEYETISDVEFPSSKLPTKTLLLPNSKPRGPYCKRSNAG